MPSKLSYITSIKLVPAQISHQRFVISSPVGTVEIWARNSSIYANENPRAQGYRTPTGRGVFSYGKFLEKLKLIVSGDDTTAQLRIGCATITIGRSTRSKKGYYIERSGYEYARGNVTIEFINALILVFERVTNDVSAFNGAGTEVEKVDLFREPSQVSSGAKKKK